LLVKTDNLENDAKTNTQIMTDRIEQAVRSYPEQWFWFHKRWKRSYPHLYKEDIAKRRRLREKRWASYKKV
jgi:KDO2-lipid IV(A) lauroyltransferase